MATMTLGLFRNKIVNSYKFSNPDPSTGSLAFFSPNGSIVYTWAMSNALILAMDSALRTLWAEPRASRPYPAASMASLELNLAEQRQAGALMRINHVGEVCAQALYTGQALACQSPSLRVQLAEASREETDHLAWTKQRLDELNDRPSLLNPLWYAGSFAIGYAAGKLGGDRVSLGFVVETERQVEAHLQSHMDLLPAADTASRAIVSQMKADEIAHAQMAMHAGAVELPAPVKSLMQAAAKVMTTVAHRF
jgi:ubiquinone biosynthesis monooxygenase Coq7